MTSFDVQQAVRAYGAWDAALRAGDVRGQARAEWFLNRLAMRVGLSRSQLLAMVEESAGIVIN
jgi:hypothetical protein